MRIIGAFSRGGPPSIEGFYRGSAGSCLARIATWMVGLMTPILPFWLLVRPAVAQAQFNFTVNRGSITITGYTGPTGTMVIPGAINGLPVTNIGTNAFYNGGFPTPYHLLAVTIPDSVTNIGQWAFAWQLGLQSVSLGNGLVTIGAGAFADCSIPSITIPRRVTSLGYGAFAYCGPLFAVTFQGNAPSARDVFVGDSGVTVYYPVGTLGWGANFCGFPTKSFKQSPFVFSSPQTQTAETGASVCFSVAAASSLPMRYTWYFNDTIQLADGTNNHFSMIDLLAVQAGAYNVIVRNRLGSATSSPASLNVIAPVERRLIPSLSVAGAAGGPVDVAFTDNLGVRPNWSPLGAVNITGAPANCFDLSSSLPTQRFYRGWQRGASNAPAALNLQMIPAKTLTGYPGDTVEVDYINQFGPVDAWATLATVTLTNWTQIYLDLTAPGQPQRLYRLVPNP